MGKGKKKDKKKYNLILPTHYGSKSGQDVIFVLEDFSINDPLIWNAMKYLFRVGKKPGNSNLQELKKAREYIDRRIKFIEKK